VVRQADDRSLPQCAERRILRRLLRRLVDDAEDGLQRLSLRIAGIPPGEGLGDGVHAGDAAFAIGGDDGVSDARERHAKLLVLGFGSASRAVEHLAEDR
jgi:hypothetical protein